MAGIAFWNAVRAGNLGEIKSRIERGDDVNAVMSERATPLYIASQDGHTDVARLLLEHGANVDAATNDGTTSLHIASLNGYINVKTPA